MLTITMYILIFCGLLSFYLYAQNTFIDVEHFSINIKNLYTNSIKIAHISDLHLRDKRDSIKSLIKNIKNENPDIIVLTGDLVDRHANVSETLLSKLCYELSKIAPSYAVTGNHEMDNENIKEWRTILKENSIHIMDNSIEIFEKGEIKLAIAGLSYSETYNFERFLYKSDILTLPMILLAHRPDLFSSYFSKSNIKVPNLVFAGHAHGGQVIIPFINKGIIAPHQGFFPKYSSGLYTSDNNVNMIVSRGVGNSLFPFRINNRPHIPIVELN
ncbi:metallophosphoesterase [Clostridium carnis]